MDKQGLSRVVALWIGEDGQYAGEAGAQGGKLARGLGKLYVSVEK